MGKDSYNKGLVTGILIGLLFLLGPFILYWLIHGDYDRYMQIISGPFPFKYLGSGPLQLWLYVISIVIGIIVLLFTIMKSRR